MPNPKLQLDRRALMRAAGGFACAVASAPWAGAQTARPAISDRTNGFPPTRVITRAPGHHWFGYYDKLQFDETNQFVLGMRVNFEHRSPTPEDVIEIGMVDLQHDDRWISLGNSRAWCWQQGCMLQWLPNHPRTILWNDREGERFVCRIMQVDSGQKRTIPHPVYAVSPDGRWGVTPDFRRIQDVRPGYGYAGPADPHEDELAPRNAGIHHVDLETGEARLIISLADIARLGPVPDAQPGIKHYFNHLLVNPGGSRFIALHRWRYPDGHRLTRLITARPDGSDIRVIVPNGFASHFIWRDDDFILCQSREWCDNPEWSNFLFEDREGGSVEEIGHGVLDPSGHMSYLPDKQWILSDTYPRGDHRTQTPHLYHVPSHRRIDLGHFHLPAIYTNEWRVDTHPRLSRDGRWVCIDSPHANAGRQLHLIDLSGIL